MIVVQQTVHAVKTVARQSRPEMVEVQMRESGQLCETKMKQCNEVRWM